jgi:hypothetical protein
MYDEKLKIVDEDKINSEEKYEKESSTSFYSIIAFVIIAIAIVIYHYYDRIDLNNIIYSIFI